MALAKGTFVLYPNITPPLTAGDYRFDTEQTLATASGPGGALDSDDLPVSSLATHVRVRSPRYQLPPDQVLSTFPPANSEGAYAMRLPQIVLRRRTLPWERTLVDGRRDLPWLALVLVAEGEADLTLNAPVAECVSADRPLLGVADTERGNYLSIAKSKIDQIFPTRVDVALLAHARAVDIGDTELMMGDDDGFLAVVISNRLPLPAKGDDGRELPVRYLACLVNLEGQFDRLLAMAPVPQRFAVYPDLLATTTLSAARSDQLAMRLGLQSDLDLVAVADLGVHADAPAPRYRIGATRREQVGPVTVSAAEAGTSSAASWGAVSGVSSSDVYVQMAHGFNHQIRPVFADPVYRFPVLLHWSFTSIGSKDFEHLMTHVDSGLLGTVTPPGADEPPPSGRPPFELVETGHVGLPQRTRVGDSVRCWYRGPLLAHPTDAAAERLALAHSADQLRIVVPDGREDLSLASAFEIGRLLALSRPSATAALLRWRQGAYQVSRTRTTWSVLDQAVFGGLLAQLDPTLVAVDSLLAKQFVGAMVKNPERVLGPPSLLVRAGRRVLGLGDPATVLAAGFGLPADVLTGEFASILSALTKVPVAAGASDPAVVAREVTGQLDAHLARLVVDTLGAQVLVEEPVIRGGPVRIASAPKGTRRKSDALDRLLGELRSEPGAEGPDDTAPGGGRR